MGFTQCVVILQEYMLPIVSKSSSLLCRKTLVEFSSYKSFFFHISTYPEFQKIVVDSKEMRTYPPKL